MRFRLRFQIKGKFRMLPMDYQYFLASWIYRVIEEGDAGFSEFLHNGGYQDGYKKHKLFNLSPLNLYPYKLWKEKSLFELQGNELSMDISFMVDRAAEHFIKGLFLKQEFYLGDKFNGIELMVTAVEAYPPPVFQKTMRYKALSPVTISLTREQDRYPQYLNPENELYAHYFLKNLSEKQKGVALAHEKTNAPAELDYPSWDFRLLSRPRSRLSVIKPYTVNETKVRGYCFDFELTAPEEIQEMVYYCGVGEKNALGWGFCEVK